MITSVRLTNFKNFEDETLKLGPFTVIVGANASGKSNIRDAFRFLHGIGRGYTLAEIIGGKIGVGGQLEWEPIRGAPNAIARLATSDAYSGSSFGIGVESRLGAEEIHFLAKIGVDSTEPGGFHMLDEMLYTDEALGYEADPDIESVLVLTIGDDSVNIGLSPSQPALSQLANGHADYHSISGLGILDDMGQMRFFEFEPNLMKTQSVPGAPLGDFGQNLPSALHAICNDGDRKEVLMAWIRELTPMDVRDFRFPEDPYGNIYLDIVEANNRKFTAVSASDGTLRFLGLLAALLYGESSKLYFFEEIDTGIHPARLPLLVDLIERQTKKNRFQVITTTHSPDLLSCLSDDSFEHVSVVYRDSESVDSVIRPLSVLPKVRELRMSQGLQVLHGTGWFEDMMEFAEPSVGCGERT